MQLSEDQKHQAISELPGNVGFQALLELLDYSQQATLGELAKAQDDRHVLRLAHLWQAQFGVFTLMATEPQRVKEFVVEQHEQFQRELENGTTMFPPHRQRQLEELENHFGELEEALNPKPTRRRK